MLKKEINSEPKRPNVGLTRNLKLVVLKTVENKECLHSCASHLFIFNAAYYFSLIEPLSLLNRLSVSIFTNQLVILFFLAKIHS